MTARVSSPTEDQIFAIPSTKLGASACLVHEAPLSERARPDFAHGPSLTWRARKVEPIAEPPVPANHSKKNTSHLGRRGSLEEEEVVAIFTHHVAMDGLDDDEVQDIGDQDGTVVRAFTQLPCAI